VAPAPFFFFQEFKWKRSEHVGLNVVVVLGPDLVGEDDRADEETPEGEVPLLPAALLFGACAGFARRGGLELAV
jgi:hypothetical protein